MSVAFEPTPADFTAARERIERYVIQTPLLRAEFLERGRGRVFLKAENLQRGGAFKARGAFNAVLSLTPEQRARGVVAFSSGNHATAVALAARDAGIAERGAPLPCCVVMPSDAVPQKIARVRELGAEIVFHGSTGAERQARAEEIARERGRTLIPSYDYAAVICGQGTLGAEILAQWNAARKNEILGLVAGPVGGGGLMAGTSAALRQTGFAGQIVGVEPATADETARSFAAGTRLGGSMSMTICDGLRATIPGELTFPILRKHVNAIATASDEEVRRAVFLLLHEMKILVEPSGAVTVAAWMNGALSIDSGDAVLILSGGNGALPTEPSA